MPDIRYVRDHETFLIPTRSATPGGSGSVRKLLGARVHVEEGENVDGFVPASDMPDEKGTFSQGFIEANRISANQQLKIFYLDVGQGDASLIEAEGAIFIIDGGPNQGFRDELIKRLISLRRADAAAGLPERQRLRINAVFVTHFDQDHYFGLIKVLESDQFVFGRIYHNGLPRYGTGATKTSASRRRQPQRWHELHQH